MAQSVLNRRSKRLRGEAVVDLTACTTCFHKASSTILHRKKLEDLPLDVLDQVARFLPLDDLPRLLCVCKSICKCLQPLLYRVIDCSRLPQDSLEQIALMLSQRPDLANAVRSLVVERQPPIDVSISYARNSLQGSLKDILNAQILKLCSNIKSLGMKGPCDLAMASHLRLKRLNISSSSLRRRAPVDLGTIAIHKELLQLRIAADCFIKNTPGALKAGDLPQLRSISGTDEVLTMFSNGRPVENYDLVLAEGDCLGYFSLPLVMERWMAFSQSVRVSTAPARRLRIGIPNSVPEDWTLQIIERVIIGLDHLESLMVICGSAPPTLLLDVLLRVPSLRKVHLILTDKMFVQHLLLSSPGFSELEDVYNLLKRTIQEVSFTLKGGALEAFKGWQCHSSWPDAIERASMPILSDLFETTRQVVSGDDTGEAMFEGDFWN